MDLTPVQVLALAKAIKDAAVKAARKELTVEIGNESVTHQVNLIAHVSGTITVGADEPYIPTTHIPMIPTLAYFLRRCGITREFAATTLRDAMADALETERKGAETITPEIARDIADIEAMMESTKTMLGTLPAAKRSGKVTTKLTVKEMVEA